MAEDPDRNKPGAGTSDTSAYAPSKSPETRREAEERESVADTRLIPGGGRGAAVNVGMSEMDRSDVPSEAIDTGQTRYRDTPSSES